MTVDFGTATGMASVIIPTSTVSCALNDVFTLNFAASAAGTYLTRGARCFLDVEIVK